MPLAGTGAVLGAAMKSAVDSLTDAQKADRDEVFKAMGEAVIAHITGPAGLNAVAVTSVGLVTAGVAVSGPGLGSLV